MSEVTDFDAIYRGEAPIEGMDAPPWDIGEPQPAVTALQQAGRIRGPVLDAGCGTGEATCYLATHGFQVTGIDASPTAVSAAREKAQRQGLDNARFDVADVAAFEIPQPRFGTVLDCTLYHSLDASAREPYFAAMHRACLPGAGLHILCFSDTAPFPADQPGPHLFSETELRSAFGGHWILDRLVPARITTSMPPQAITSAGHEVEVDEHDRVLLPAWLASAHRNDTVQ